ncbi:MAG: COX15/CtaA family protein [Chitinophagaceae bacterium]|nr:COX15/CtaA family protein [Chitinophagaceae bacterium]
MKKSSQSVGTWLLIGVSMMIVQIILGGITRLTGSGLSITEWKPILGTLPPMNQYEWNTAFDKYKQIAQYKHLNFYFTLQDFKSIYFWEWLHRLWGRLIGLAFLIPFGIFLLQHRIKSEMIKPLMILFLLGALQGIIGWLMVQSGLNEENIYVSHIRLAIHFMAALLLLVYTFLFSLSLLMYEQKVISNSRLKILTVVIIALIAVQFVFGSFMAGLKAATVAPTWPLIDGEYFPANFLQYKGETMSFFSAIINNPVAVHFVHRNVGYLIFLLIVIWTIMASKGNNNAVFNSVKWWPIIFATVQICLGIATVLTSVTSVQHQWGVFEWMAQLHQLIAILLLLSLVLVLFILRKKQVKPFSPEVDPHII